MTETTRDHVIVTEGVTKQYVGNGVPVNADTHLTVSYLHEFANRDRGIKEQLRFGVARYF